MNPAFIKYGGDHADARKKLTPKCSGDSRRGTQTQCSSRGHNVNGDAKHSCGRRRGWLHVLSAGEKCPMTKCRDREGAIARNDRPLIWMTPPHHGMDDTQGGTRPAWLDSTLASTTASGCTIANMDQAEEK